MRKPRSNFTIRPYLKLECVILNFRDREEGESIENIAVIVLGSLIGGLLRGLRNISFSLVRYERILSKFKTSSNFVH